MEFIYSDNLIYMIYLVVIVCILVKRENDGFNACVSDRWCDNRSSQAVGQLESNLTV